MNNLKINQFAKSVIKERALPSLLSSLVQEIKNQSGYEAFLNCATDIREKEIFRYMFLAIPENKESEKIEMELTQLVQNYNKAKDQQTDLFCPKCGRHLRFHTKSLTGENVYKCGHGTPRDHTIKESEAKRL